MYTMSRCQYLKINNEQCKNKASRKYEHNGRYCWKHQFYGNQSGGYWVISWSNMKEIASISDYEKRDKEIETFINDTIANQKDLKKAERVLKEGLVDYISAYTKNPKTGS